MEERLICKDSSIQKYFAINSFDLYIKREDRTIASFGTKLRKLSGLIGFLKKSNIKTVIVYGNPHSNYMACFVYVLNQEGFGVISFFRTKDISLKTMNSNLCENFSSKIFYYSSWNDFQMQFNEIKTSLNNYYLVPEYAIHESSFQGLSSLWEEIDKSKSSFSHIFLDVGSGLTFLSALEFFSQKDVEIIGVAIGNKKENLEIDLDNISKKLSKKSIDSYSFQLLKPCITPRFGKTSRTLNNFIKDIWKEKELPLEPIYSGKSLYTILEYIKEKSLTGRGLYIHQGGLLNFLKLFLDV